MSIPDFALIQKLNLITFWINQVVPPLHIAFGTFGNVFNIIIFTRRALRSNPCSMYFLASSVNNCLVIYLGIIPNYIATNWQMDPSQTNSALCKIRQLVQYVPFALVLWFPVLASVDRFLSSSEHHRLRRWSSLSTARIMIIGITIVFVLAHSHMLIFYKSDGNEYMRVCGVFSYDYFLFFNVFGPITACLLPIVLMCVFGMLMILNVRRVNNRILPRTTNTVATRHGNLRPNDGQLLIMLLFQVLTTLALSIPYVFITSYYAFGLVLSNINISFTGQTIFIFVHKLFNSLYLINPILGFYIYTLTGPKFRVEMKRCTRSGLATLLTGTGLVRYLSPRARQAVLGPSVSDTTNQVIFVRSKPGNSVRPD